MTPTADDHDGGEHQAERLGVAVEDLRRRRPSRHATAMPASNPTSMATPAEGGRGPLVHPALVGLDHRADADGQAPHQRTWTTKRDDRDDAPGRRRRRRGVGTVVSLAARPHQAVRA